MLAQKFFQKNSPIDFLDPRVRILGAFVFCFTVVFLNSWTALGLALIMAMLFPVLARVCFRLFFLYLGTANIFIGFLWLVLPLELKPDLLHGTAGIHYSKDGLFLASVITLRCNAIFMCSAVLVGGLSIDRLGQALHQLKVPGRFIFLLLFSYRSIAVLGKEYRRLQQALQVRCFSLNTSLLTYRTLSCLVGMLFLRSMRRAETTYNAMRCRCFTGQFYTLYKSRIKGHDLLFLGALLSASLILIFFEMFYEDTPF